MRKIIYIFFLILILNCNKTYATNENIIENQSKELNIDNFIEETENITNTNIDLKTIFDNSIKGESSKNIIIKTTLNICFRKRIKTSIKYDNFSIIINYNSWYSEKYKRKFRK